MIFAKPSASVLWNSREECQGKEGTNSSKFEFSPPLLGWRVFEGNPPAPTLKETIDSKAGVTVASLAAAAAEVKASKKIAAKHVSNQARLVGMKWQPSEQKSSIASYSEDTQFVPLLPKLLCQAVRRLGGFEQEGIFRKAGSSKDAE